MYKDQLSERTINIEDLYLDPNNPRFWNQETRRKTPDSRTMEQSVQSRVEQEIRKHGIEELQNSILRNGFLPLDRIVVRPIRQSDGRYVIVEGNRRLAALRLLRQRIEEETVVEDHISDEYLNKLQKDTDKIDVLVYEGSESDDDDISWILQGIRHLGGIRNWEPAQRAKLVSNQVENGSASYTEVGQKFGLSPRAVGRLHRSYKALEQMRQDEEFGQKTRNDYFSLFEEAHRNINVRKWLAWNEDEFIFENNENLKIFYSWITPDEDSDNVRRIHDPKHVKCLGTLVGGNHASLITQVEQHEIGIETADLKAREMEPTNTWKERLQGSLDDIKSLPSDVIRENPREYRDILDDMINEIRQFRTMADTLLHQDESNG